MSGEAFSTKKFDILEDEGLVNVGVKVSFSGSLISVTVLLASSTQDMTCNDTVMEMNAVHYKMSN